MQQLQKQPIISVRKLEEFGIQPSLIIQRDIDDLTQPLALQSISFSTSAIERGVVPGFPKNLDPIVIPAGYDRLFIPMKLTKWRNNLNKDEKLSLSVTIGDCPPVALSILIHHKNTRTASESPIVTEIIEILDKEVECSVQLLSPQEFKAMNFNLFTHTDPAYTFALLYPEVFTLKVLRCLSTFAEINKSTVGEVIYAEQKLRLEVWKLLNVSSRSQFPNILQRLFIPQLTVEAKRVLRCLEHRPCQSQYIIGRTCFSKQEVTKILDNLQKNKLIERGKTSDYFEITAKGQKQLNCYRTHIN